MNNFKIKRTTNDVQITVESGMTLAALQENPEMEVDS